MTRELLIDATERLICAGGLSSLSTQKVARESGVAEGTIYRHFQSRDELVITTLRERLPGEFQPYVDALVGSAGSGTIDGNLSTFIRAVVPIFAIIAPALGMLAADPTLAARNAEAIQTDGKGPSHLVDQIAEYFREEQRLGRICGSIAARTASAMLVAFCFYRSLMRHICGEDPTRLSDAELSRELAKMLGRGIENRDDDPA